MIVYVVERNIDVGTDRAVKARAVIAKQYPDAKVIGGANFYLDNRMFRNTYAAEVATADVMVTIRRTLGLGGTIEVEEALRLSIPVFTVHGQKLQPITHLWYVEQECVRARNGKTCLSGWEHRARMHTDPNRVAETRAAPTPMYAQHPGRL